jgi:hypothetical protein
VTIEVREQANEHSVVDQTETAPEEVGYQIARKEQI